MEMYPVFLSIEASRVLYSSVQTPDCATCFEFHQLSQAGGLQSIVFVYEIRTSTNGAYIFISPLRL